MSGIALALRQARYQNRAFWRNPPAAFFTVLFPLMFLVIFNLLFGNDEAAVPGGRASTSNFYVPAITAFGVISASFTNIAMGVSISRDEGVLKRVRGTPLPAWSYMAARIMHATFIALLLTAIGTLAGALFYDVDVPTTTLAAVVVTVLVGAASFSALGLAMTSVVPNAEAAPAVVNGVVLPLLFISDVYIPDTGAPDWLRTIANVFPVKHFSEALQTPFSPFDVGSGFEWGHLAVIAAWGVVGAGLAIRFFSWEPRR
ncbi:MAG: ABC transporter permease [Actinomycetota bacterium]|nr:ABC transporter permease [Actinomycetota bacterium]